MRLLERAHPLISFLYLLSVMGITVFTRHPLLIGASLMGAALLLILSGKGRSLLWSVPMILICAVTNPVFSHRGETVLFFVGDHAFTMEAVIYGAIFGGMMAAVCGWSISATQFVTSDKYIWLFGRILPTSGLVLSCTIRFVPLFIRRTISFSDAQGAESIGERLTAFSSSLGYSAEQAMISADSMKARGYGCTKRTSYSIYRFGMRESLQLLCVAAFAISGAALMLYGAGAFECYPRLSDISFKTADIFLYITYGILCLLPSFAAIWEQLRRTLGYSALKEH